MDGLYAGDNIRLGLLVLELMLLLVLLLLLLLLSSAAADILAIG
jgi:hypothetical protein